MKKVILILIVIFGVNDIVAQKINWVSLEEAVELQKKNPKKIMIDMYTNWCGPCKLLDKRTFQNQDVATYVNENYYAVKFNAEGNEKVVFRGQEYTNPNYDPARANKRNSAHQLSRYFQIQAYPTVVFLDEKLDVLVPLRGFKTPQQMELYLKMFGKDDHKNIKNQQEFKTYADAFVPQFKG